MRAAEHDEETANRMKEKTKKRKMGSFDWASEERDVVVNVMQGRSDVMM